MTALSKEDNPMFSFKDHLVTGNILTSLHQHLKGKGCRVHTADMKLKVSLNTMAVCDPTDSAANFKTKPQVLVEAVELSDIKVHFVSNEGVVGGFDCFPMCVGHSVHTVWALLNRSNREVF